MADAKSHTKGPINYYMPVGMTTRGTSSILTGGTGAEKHKPVFQMTIDDLREAGGFVVGTPKEVVQRLKEIITRLGVSLHGWAWAICSSRASTADCRTTSRCAASN